MQGLLVQVMVSLQNIGMFLGHPDFMLSFGLSRFFTVSTAMLFSIPHVLPVNCYEYVLPVINMRYLPIIKMYLSLF